MVIKQILSENNIPFTELFDGEYLVDITALNKEQMNVIQHLEADKANVESRRITLPLDDNNQNDKLCLTTQQ